MYFNKPKEDTNIDKEFKERSLEIRSRKTLKILFIAIGVLAVISIIALIIFFAGNRLVLQGAKKLTVYQGTRFDEPGYKAYDLLNNNRTSDVVVSGSVDTKTLGKYVINAAKISSSIRISTLCLLTNRFKILILFTYV